MTTRTLDRRRFVQLMGAGAAVAVAGPLASEARAARGVPLKVGVMVPTGSSYARMGESLLDGLKLGFHGTRGERRAKATLVPAEVERGYGGALSTAESLLDGGADVVVAGVSTLVAERIGDLFSSRRTPLIVANVGAHVVQPSARNDYVLHNSLLYWQASFAAGRWAAAHAGKRAFVASALSDSGYDTIYAFRRGFESAGGTVVGDGVTHADPTNAGLSDLFAAARDSGANALYGLYSGGHAVEFVRAYAGAGLDAKLLAGSLAVEDCVLGATGAAAAGTTTCASWTATRKTDANHAFAKAFRSRCGRAPDPFAALGYDTAALIAKGAHRAAKRMLGTRRLVEALHGASLASPRGTLVVDARTNTVTGPLWIRSVKQTAHGLANVDLAERPPVSSFPGALSPLADGTVAGYLNEYLCA